MTNKDILTKAINLAIAGGWLNWYKHPVEDISFDDEEGTIWVNTGKKNVTAIAANSMESLIFNHDFAKALWGEHKLTDPAPNKTFSDFKAWEYHLQQMVIDEDPIQYLEENI